MFDYVVTFYIITIYYLHWAAWSASVALTAPSALAGLLRTNISYFLVC